MQHTRCAYYQDAASPCNRRTPGDGCAAIGGLTRSHAILGWSDHCIATHPSDFCVPLAALDAVVEVVGPQGKREIPLETLHRLPGTTPEIETALEPGELILSLTLPGDGASFAGHARYLKLRDRTSYAFAVVSAAAMLRIEGGRIEGARLALGGVAAKPWRVHAAEAALVGRNPTPDAFAGAADILLADARPSGDNAFKIELARRIVSRALILATEGTPDVMPALPGSPFSSLSGATDAA